MIDTTISIRKGKRAYLSKSNCVIVLCLLLLFPFISTKATPREIDRIEQNRTANLRGTIRDTDGMPLAGATVQIKGSTRGVIADVDGNFEFPECPIGNVLVVSFIGMQPIERVYQGERTIDFVMSYLADELEEVEVVAFAKQKKESVLASISTVKPAELKVPSSNLTTAFAGRVAGLISYQTTGEPGQDNASFFIRGITTFGAEAKKDPLILIDGIELESDDLARLNTDDIASFSIMKDATATALYGARGANGVILVTTKEGREGKAKFSARLESSYSSPTRKVELADPITYMRMQNEAIKTRDPLGLMLYSEEKIVMTEKGLYPNIFPATDWYDTMFKDVINNQRANLSVSGGGKVAKYYVAANITRDQGNLKIDKRNNFNSNINLMKYNFRSNVNINLTESTELIARLSVNFDEYTGPIDGGSGMYKKVIQANPVLFKPYYEPDEQYSYAKHILFGNFGNATYINPYAESLKGYRDYGKNTTIVSFELKQDFDKFLEGLTARAMINFNRYSEYNVVRQYTPFYYSISAYDLQKNSYKLQRLNPEEGREFIDYSPGERLINSTFYVEASTEYNRSFVDVHNVNALLVYTLRDYKVGVADNLQLSLPARNIGLAGRFAYNFDSRYFAEFNFGYNGSERFSANNRYGFFPSIGAAWMISNESFYEPLKSIFPQFKLKGTYGLVGNDAIGDWRDRFYYLSEVNMNANRSVNWGTQLNYNPGGVDMVRYANDRIGWETAYKTNIGVELSTAMGLSVNADLFKETRKIFF